MEEELDEENRLTRDVYAYFGRAYYMAECVHRGLVNVVAMFDLDKQSGTRPRIEECMKVAAQQTLGELVPLAKPLLPTALHASLDWALAMRNFLAHGFWYDRIHMMTTTTGMAELIAELDATTAQFRELDRIVNTLAFDHLRSLGLTEEQFERAVTESKSTPAAPFPHRRIPKTEERIRIVKAWAMQRGDSGSALILEDDAGERWQLCDAGLGWCFLDPSDGASAPLELLVLPADIVARPKRARPWNFKLHVSTGALISVRRDEKTGQMRWSINAIEDNEIT